jgi:hypothetical protein
MLYVRPAARLRGVTTGELQTRTANLNLVPESPTPCALPTPPPSSPQPSYDIKCTPLRIMLAVQADLLAGNPGPTDSDPVIASSNLAPPLTVSAAPTAPIRIAGSRRNATCTRPACQAAARSPVLPLSRLSPVHQKCTSPCPAPAPANPAPSLSLLYIIPLMQILTCWRWTPLPATSPGPTPCHLSTCATMTPMTPLPPHPM